MEIAPKGSIPARRTIEYRFDLCRCDWNGIQRGLKILRPWKRDWGFNSPHRHQLICSSQRTRLRQRNGNGVVGGQRVVDQDEHLLLPPHVETADEVGSNPTALCVGVRIPLWRPFCFNGNECRGRSLQTETNFKSRAYARCILHRFYRIGPSIFLRT